MEKRDKKAAGYTPQQKNTIVVASITSFVTTFMGSALNLSIPEMEKYFGVNSQYVGWVVTVYMLTCAALAVPFGKLADLVKRKTILLPGILIFSISSAAAVISREMWVLLVFRFLQGIGASMIFSTNIALLMEHFDDDMRGKVLGYATCANYAGLSAGPVAGGILCYNLGWKSIFMVSAAVAAVAFLWAVLKLPKEQYKESFKKDIIKELDISGIVSFAASMTAGMYGLSVLNYGWKGYALVAAGLVFIVLFLKAEKKAEKPLIDISVFRKNKAFSYANIAAFINYGANYVISYMLSVYLQTVKGFSPQTAGFVLLVNTLVLTVFSLFSGRLSDKIVPQYLSAAGMSLTAVALGMLALMPEKASHIYIISVLAISGLGFAFFASPNTKAVMTEVPEEGYGSASSILATMRSSGHTFSMAVVSGIIGIYMGNESVINASVQIMTRTFHTIFSVFTILCILGIFMAIKRKV